ncbi:MAG: PQQ-binding-like beta-propeller repeat protein [Candidatus Thiodiazotropha sp. (ex Notomyrtea botanica)]|nr:PQQ-binding-like beta-propeller repeat protein [Candidatus Thiodiazotropha sp. (ex Notomyrtea botanica)]
MFRIAVRHFISVVMAVVALSALAGDRGDNHPVTPLIISDSGLYAFDRDSLEMRWQQLNDQQTSSPVLIDKRVLVSGSGGLYALDANSGKVIWQRNTAAQGFSVVPDGSRLFLASRDGSLQALNTEDGQVIWERRFPGWVYPPAKSNDLLFTGGSDGQLWAIERQSGDVRWSVSLGQEMVYSPVALSDGRIVVTTFGREAIALDQQGNILWRQRYPTIVTTPLVVGSQLFFTGYDHSLLSVNADGGEVLWARQLPERLSTSLDYRDGVLIATFESGQVWELSSQTGERLRDYQFPGEPIDTLRLAGGVSLGFIRSLDGPKVMKAIFSKHSKEQ